MGVAAVATALARSGLIIRMRSIESVLPRIAGLVLLLAGAYVAWYGVWELRVLHAGAGTDPLVSAAESLQRWLAAVFKELEPWVLPPSWAHWRSTPFGVPAAGRFIPGGRARTGSSQRFEEKS